MKCEHCGKIIFDIIQFCPFCGGEKGGRKRTTELDLREKIVALDTNKQYEEIFALAIEGNVIAKYYYIRYVMSVADKSQFADDQAFTENLHHHMESGSVFPATALGIYLFYHGQKKVLGATNDTAIEKGRKLIKESADKNEPAALTMVAQWLLKGDGMAKDEFTAYKMMKSAADQGYPLAIYYLGTWHSTGSNGISKDEKLGKHLIEKAAFWGELNAMAYIREQNDEWFESTLDYAISEESMKDVLSLVSSPKSGIEQNYTMPFQCEIETCQTKEDYINLYKRVRDTHSDDENTKNILSLLETFVSNLFDLSLEGQTLEEAQDTSKKAQKIWDLINAYKCPQHFLHLRDDLKTLQIDMDDKSLSDLFATISKTFRERYSKEISSYLTYLKAKKEAADATGKGCLYTGLIILAIVAVFIFPVVGIILAGLVFFGKVGDVVSKHAFKKLSPEIKNDYLLINSLIGYGYTPVDSTVGKNEYDPKAEYQNDIPSILENNGQSK